MTPSWMSAWVPIDDLGLARGDPGERLRALLALDRGGQQLDPVGAAPQQAAQREEVLLGQDLGGGHEGRLVAVLEDDDHGEERHQRLARAHVALDEAVHGVGRAEVVGDLPQDAPLRPGEREGQDALHRLASGVLDLEGRALPLRAHAAAAPGEAELEEKQLLEDQAQVAGRAEARSGGRDRRPRRAGARAGGPRRGRSRASRSRRSAGSGSGEAGGHLLREVREDAPQGLDRERAELLVDRDEAAGVDAAVLVPLDDLVLRASA